jgi:hypothetical protein
LSCLAAHFPHFPIPPNKLAAGNVEEILTFSSFNVNVFISILSRCLFWSLTVGGLASSASSVLFGLYF